MNDLERTKEFLDSLGILFLDVTYPTEIHLVRAVYKQRDNDIWGPSLLWLTTWNNALQVLFKFDKDGKFLSIGACE